MKKKAKVIVGPTASGKTARSIEVAKSCDGEIINCDSLQVYNDLQILTSFPTVRDRLAVNHRLFGYLRYDQKTTAVEWAKLAAEEIQETLNSGKCPIIVGGTGMYLGTLIHGISPIPAVSKLNRKRANDFAAKDFEAVCSELYSIDPELENLLPRSKHRQVVRAYEVFLETGRSIRYFWALPKLRFIDDVDFDIEVISCERSELYERIASRFDQMLTDGAIDEVSNLLTRIGNPNRVELFKAYPIFNAIGAKEITLFLDGVYSYDQMRELSIINSRHYAKRQMTWFRHQIDI